MKQKNIRDIRKESGLSCADMAEMVGVDSTTYSKWERNVQLPDLRTAVKMIDALGDVAMSKGVIKKQDAWKWRGFGLTLLLEKPAEAVPQSRRQEQTHPQDTQTDHPPAKPTVERTPDHQG